jgi:hypothetical protein
VQDAALVQDVIGEVQPPVQGRQLLKSGRSEVFVLFNQLNLLLVLLINLVNARRNYPARKRDPCDLGSQQMLLPSGKVRVRNDLGLQIPSKHILYVPRSSYLIRLGKR